MTAFDSIPRAMAAIAIAIAASLIPVQESSAQTTDIAPATDELRDFAKDFPDGTLELHTTGLPSTITGVRIPTEITGEPAAPLTPRQMVEEFFSNRGQSFFMLAQPQADIEVLSEKQDPDFTGRFVVRVQQKMGNLPIFGAQASLVVQPGIGVTSLTSNIVPPQDIGLEPRIGLEEVKKIAFSVYEESLARMADLKGADMDLAPQSIDDNKPELMVFVPDVFGMEGRPSLTWKNRIGSFVIFVDAVEGNTVFQYLDHQSVLSRRTYDMNNTGQFPGNLVLDDNGSTASPTSEPAVAHANAGRVYQYFWDQFQRDSFDDNDFSGANGGATIVSHVNYKTMGNAYWDPQRQAMVYGPGFAIALDIVGHEISHAVISHEANLAYFNESGALNEAYADMFGAFVESKHEALNWALGEKLPGFAPPDAPLRDMADPHNGGFYPSHGYSSSNRGQPDHYSELLSSADAICATTTDSMNGCVHFNSGIINKAVYLMSVGGSHYGIDVQGIGIDKVARVFYRALVMTLTPSSSMADAANKVNLACSELQTGGFMTDNDCGQVRNAFTAVGL